MVQILGACFISFLLIFFPQVVWAGVTGTRAFNPSLPIETLPFQSIGPSLGLEYISQSGNGMLGVGWRLTLASLQQRRIAFDASVSGGRRYERTCRDARITRLAIPHYSPNPAGLLAAIEESIEKRLKGG